MIKKGNDRHRLLWINFMIVAALFFFIVGLISLSMWPDATSYIGWLFSSSCFMVAFLMIRRKILKRLGR
jgi:hypothetical protein